MTPQFPSLRQSATRRSKSQSAALRAELGGAGAGGVVEDEPVVGDDPILHPHTSNPSPSYASRHAGFESTEYAMRCSIEGVKVYEVGVEVGGG